MALKRTPAIRRTKNTIKNHKPTANERSKHLVIFKRGTNSPSIEFVEQLTHFAFTKAADIEVIDFSFS
jgi:hypothetical protein